MVTLFLLIFLFFFSFFSFVPLNAIGRRINHRLFNRIKRIKWNIWYVNEIKISKTWLKETSDKNIFVYDLYLKMFLLTIKLWYHFCWYNIELFSTDKISIIIVIIMIIIIFFLINFLPITSFLFISGTSSKKKKKLIHFLIFVD